MTFENLSKLNVLLLVIAVLFILFLIVTVSALSNMCEKQRCLIEKQRIIIDWCVDVLENVEEDSICNQEYKNRYKTFSEWREKCMRK